MTNAHERLRAKRAELLKQVEEIDAVLRRYAEIEEAAQRLISSGTVREPVASAKQHDHKPIDDQRPTPMPEFEKQLRAFLEEIAQPISRQALLNALKERGVVIGGANELNTLGTRLHRTPWVVNLKGHGYWLKARDYPQANHFNPAGANRELAEGGGFLAPQDGGSTAAQGEGATRRADLSALLAGAAGPILFLVPLTVYILERWRLN